MMTRLGRDGVPRNSRHEQRDRPEREAPPRVNPRDENFTPLTKRRSQILKEVMSTQIIKRPPPNPRPMGDEAGQWCEYHQAYGHNTDNCRTFHMHIEKLVQEGHLGRYVQGRGGGHHDKRSDMRSAPNKHSSRSPKRGRGREESRDKESGGGHERNERGVVNTIAGGFSGGGVMTSPGAPAQATWRTAPRRVWKELSILTSRARRGRGGARRHCLLLKVLLFLCMRGNAQGKLLYDPEIEKTAKKNRKTARLARETTRLTNNAEKQSDTEVSSTITSDDEIRTMGDKNPPPPPPPVRTLGDYGQNNGRNANLGFQPVNPVSFDIKNTVLNALKENQYSGAESQCPNLHLEHFDEACGYTDPPNVSESDKKLRLFKLSLTGRARDWIDTLPPNTIATWDELAIKFKERYFPIHKFLERRNEITTFEREAESLYDAWEKFKLCLKKCPNHGLDNTTQMQHFTQGLRPQTRMVLDASAGGSLRNKVESQARELIENMAQNEYRVQNDRGPKKKPGKLELDIGTALLAGQSKMSNNIESLLKIFTNQSASQAQVNAAQGVTCDFCHQNHANGECFPAGSEEALYLANFRKSNPNSNPFSNTYNKGWRDHPNFGWGGNTSQSQQQTPPPQNSQQKNSSPLEDKLDQFIKFTQGGFEAMRISQDQLKATQTQMQANQDIANKNTEASIKNLETQIGQLSRQFPATQNKGFEGSTKDNPRNESCMAINLRSREVPSPEVVSKKKGKLRDAGGEKREAEKEKNESEGEVEKEWEIVTESDKERDEVVEKKKGKSVAVQEDQKGNERSVHAKLPYTRKKKAKEEDPTQFKKFMKMLHSLQMNIPFAEALEQMPVCAKFLKELLTKKRKPLDDETVNMTEERALCDLGASINLMPLSMMKRIPGAVAKPTKMQLSLADRSITHPYGILQNVLVRCAEFVFPADFVILDMEEDAEVCFQVFEATTFGGPVPECFKVEVLEEVEGEPLSLEEALLAEKLKKDDDALVWSSGGINSPFCLHKKITEEEFKMGFPMDEDIPRGQGKVQVWGCDDFTDFEGIYPHDDDPLVISMVTAGFQIKRAMVDSGSSANVLFWKVFEKLGLPKEVMREDRGALLGFSGESVEILGYVDLRTTFGEGENAKTIMVKYIIVDGQSSYNLILGRPALNGLGAIVFTSHLCIKYPLEGDEAERKKIVNDQRCNFLDLDPRDFSREEEEWHPRPAEEQRKRKMSLEKQKTVEEETQKLVNAKFIREVKYPTWLANVVMVKKASGKWRMCTDYTDLNKMCPKDDYPLPSIDQLVDNASGYGLLSFMDAYLGYNQIRMHPEDEEKTAFMTDRANFCYKVMPFGLKNVGATCRGDFWMSSY
ncbi:hypothetical protein TSUD_55830 [Trifolium subterraneum]|uniref:Uncharacterized protein n=1 Tax=Trifolium subterraneum TaxID=3900 RepID=A0A2Z6NED0_TRISU|nr:hypothetical protein TSUD_55830 [Trifolium subterraneum]